LYSRQITQAPKKLIRNGKPLFGTYSGLTEKLDIKGVKFPFGIIPLPTFITNFAIRSQLFVAFNTENYIGQIAFFDAKLFGYCEVVFWDTQTNAKSVYNAFIGPRKRLIPKNLKKGICICFKKSHYIKIGWNRAHKRISMFFSLAGNPSRPNAGALLTANTDDSTDIISVMPAPTLRRCSATWLNTFSVHGNFFVNKDSKAKPSNNCSGYAIISINRCYYKLHVKYNNVTGLGNYDNRRLSFRLTTSSFDARNTNNCNSNFLFLDKEVTPLPQVFITHPFGMDKRWIIQDTENMIDLTFTPVSENLRKMNTVVFRTVYHTIYGFFEGTLLTKDGEKLFLKSFPGIVQATMLRL